jgi:ABC-2 type transport system permease protein
MTMDNVLATLRVYLRLQLVRLRVQVEYEADFWLGVVGIALTQAVTFTFIWTVFDRLPVIVGWKLWEVALIYALVAIPRGLHDLLLDGAWQVPGNVYRGELDKYYCRPIPIVVQILCQSSKIHGLGNVAFGIFLLVRASATLQLHWSAPSLLLLGYVILNSLAIIGSLCLMANSVAFWDNSSGNTLGILQSYAGDMAQLPITFFGSFVTFLLTWIVPYGFVGFYPAVYFLDKAAGNRWPLYFLPVTGPVLVGLAAVVWKKGLSRYEGAGH